MLVRILLESKNSVVKQYTELLRMDKVELMFAEDALRLIAQSSMKLQTGARGLKSILVRKLYFQSISWCALMNTHNLPSVCTTRVEKKLVFGATVVVNVKPFR